MVLICFLKLKRRSPLTMQADILLYDKRILKETDTNFFKEKNSYCFSSRQKWINLVYY